MGRWRGARSLLFEQPAGKNFSGRGGFGLNGDHRVEFAGRCVALDFFIEACGVEFGEPFAKAREFALGEGGDGGFDLVDIGHDEKVA